MCVCVCVRACVCVCACGVRARVCACDNVHCSCPRLQFDFAAHARMLWLSVGGRLLHRFRMKFRFYFEEYGTTSTAVVSGSAGAVFERSTDDDEAMTAATAPHYQNNAFFMFWVNAPGAGECVLLPACILVRARRSLGVRAGCCWCATAVAQARWCRLVGMAAISGWCPPRLAARTVQVLTCTTRGWSLAYYPT